MGRGGVKVRLGGVVGGVGRSGGRGRMRTGDVGDGYYEAYKPITLSCILFMFIEMKFIHCHSCVMFAMKSMSMCNDYVNYDEIII